ncbi:SDR family oxidoreductase [Aliikangiella sp. G2MR2-5]|uniref:SDR family NAD(P)-dependent oxidoreductase n=1 Tax=Aliikangiella sp. G2MR2-5 TaxID=2788943 RepID=UPI0018AB660D|nr:SDR family NAD(P)-dependent oxidoreductase [Aliikangiella sp. G2MR2-5]
MRYSFRQKVVWITGASSGIGLSLAKKLQQEGAYIAVTSRSELDLQALYGLNENILVASGDVTSREENQRIVEMIIETFGQLDCIILNAGNAEYINIQDFRSGPFERMMEVNFFSQTRAIEVALPYLRQSSSPYLVAMSSSVAWLGLPRGEAYSASKAATRNLCQGLRLELAKENIPVSWICPGFVRTPLTDKNDFPMPFRIEAEDAAEKIINGLVKQKAEIHFPKAFTLLMKLLAVLPANLSKLILTRVVTSK